MSLIKKNKDGVLKKINFKKANFKKNKSESKSKDFSYEPSSREVKREAKAKNLTNKFTDEELQIIQKSIPRLNFRKRIKVSGATLITLIALLGFIFMIFYVIAVVYNYSIGIGSYNNSNNITARIFFLFIPEFWSKIVMRETHTIYGFFSSIVMNFNNAGTLDSYMFILGFYVSMIAGAIELILAIILFSIALYQKVNRNVWIALFSLIPAIGPIICVYYLGVLHFETTFAIQKLLNRKNMVVEQEKNLKEQLINLNQSFGKENQPKKTTPQFNNNFEKTQDEPFSFRDPIGEKHDKN